MFFQIISKLLCLSIHKFVSFWFLIKLNLSFLIFSSYRFIGPDLLLSINIIIRVFKRILRRSWFTNLLRMKNFNLNTSISTPLTFSRPIHIKKYLWFILACLKTFLNLNLKLIFYTKIILKVYMLKKVNLLNTKQTMIDFFVFYLGLHDQIKYSLRKLKYFCFIKKFLLTQITNKRSQNLKINNWS